MQNSQLIKICVVGDVNVGKTSILQRIVYQKFSDTLQPAVNAD